MNFYPSTSSHHHHHHHREPSAPPRRKRSLSTSRYDSFHQQQSQQIQDYFHGLPQNRMKTTNFSTDHIPALYGQILPNFPLISNQNPCLNRGQQQNFNQNYNNPDRFPNPNYCQHPNQQFNHQPQQYQPVPLSNSASLLLAGMAGPIPRLNLNLGPAHHSFSSNNTRYGLSSTASYGSDLPTVTGYGLSGRLSPTSPTTKLPIRTHYDLVKSTNVQYNPYQTNVNPSLMARPSLESYQPLQISQPVATAIARGRDSMYNSREHLNENLGLDHDYHVRFSPQNKTPPARPPPPRFNRLSTENLSSFGDSGSGLNYTSTDYVVPERRNRDRRSLSPTRLSSPSGQRPYGSRSTSPLPNLNRTTSNFQSSYSPQLSRTTRSRDHSRESSPIRTFLNFSKNLLTPSPNKTMMSITTTTSIQNDRPLDDNDNLFTNTSKQQSYSTITRTDYNNNNQQSNDLLQVPTDSFQAIRVNDLRLIQPQSDQHFSQAFTDHCDQYKSVTSKILGKNYNRSSGDFGTNEQMFKDDLSPESRMMNNKSPTQEMYRMVNNPDLMDKQQQNDQQSISLNLTNTLATQLNDKLQTIEQNRQKQEQLRRNSSNSNLSQRKASLPAEYINSAKNNVEQLKLSNDWSRENVAHLAHEARERKLHPQSKFKQNVKEIGVWFTRQFIFLLICSLNILLAYMFYNLIYALPD